MYIFKMYNLRIIKKYEGLNKNVMSILPIWVTFIKKKIADTFFG